MLKFPLLYIILILIAGPPAEVSDNGEWELAKEKDGIKVYTRKLEDSRIKEFKAESEVETTLSSLVAFMTDIPALPEWVHECQDSEFLEKVSEKELIYYIVIDAPFPFSDRDMIQKMSLTQDKKTKELTVSLNNLPDYLDEKDGRVRMPDARGFWRFTPTNDDKLKILFQYRNDPGGNLPAWLVNPFIVSSPFNSVQNLREMVKNEKYQKAKIDWIVEPD